MRDELLNFVRLCSYLHQANQSGGALACMGECLEHVLRTRNVRGEQNLLKAINLLGLLQRPHISRERAIVPP